MSKDFNSKTAIIVIILTIALLVVGIKYKNNFHNDIDKNKQITEGKIYFISSASKKVFKKIYKYEFEVDDKILKGEIRKSLDFEVKTGDVFPVEYSSKNPKHNRMIFDKLINR